MATRNLLSFPGGTSDYVNCGNHAAHSGFSTAFTVEFWVKFNKTGRIHILEKSQTTGNQRAWFVYKEDNGYIYMAYSQDGSGLSGTYWDLDMNSGANQNTWHHIAVVWQSSVLPVLYLNGVSQTRTGDDGTVSSIYASSSDLYFGNSQYSSGRELDGGLFEVRLWDTARTASQIQNNRDIPLAGDETGLVGYWKTDEGSGSTLTDSSPNEHDGSLNGNTEWASEDVTGWTGSGVSTPISFSGPVDDQSYPTGDAITPLDIGVYFSGTETPFSYAIQSGTLPDGLSLDGSTGEITGTPTTEETSSIVVRATDDNSDTADTNEFDIVVSDLIIEVYSDATAVNASSSTSLNVAIDAAVEAGDLIVIHYMTRSAVTAPSGFTKHAEVIVQTDEQRSGFFTKTSDGTEGGTNVTITQASSNRIEAFHHILRGPNNSLIVSEENTADEDSAASGTLSITESLPFAAIGNASNRWTDSGEIGFSLGAGSDEEFSILNTGTVGNVNGNRLTGAIALYPGSDTAVIEWVPEADSGTPNWGQSLIGVVEDSGVQAVSFDGPVPTLNGTESTPFSESLSGYFNGSETPFTYSVQAGTLPDGLTLDSSTGEISGTPTTAGTSSDIVVRATDDASNTADTNEFDIVIAEPSAETVAEPDDFDSAMGTASVTNPFTTTPSISFTPYNPTDQVFGWMNGYFRLTGCLDKTPEFTIDFSEFRRSGGTGSVPNDTDYEVVWRYVDDVTVPSDGRPRAWTKFANASGDPVRVVSHSAPFTSDRVEIAVKFRWRYLDTQRAFDYLDSSEYAVELPSSIADSGLPKNVHAQITHSGSTANNAPQVPINMYCTLLDDTSAQPVGGKDKLNIIAIPGQHASEDQGNYFIFELAYLYVEATGELADWIRQHCRIFVYDANPQGRYYGNERWTDETGGDEDPNRSWDDSNSEQINAVKAAIAQDMSYTDIIWDGHGDYRLNGNGITEQFGMFDSGAPADVLFRNRVGALYGETYYDLGTTSDGSAAWYGNSVLDAQISTTNEFPIAADGYPVPETMFQAYAGHFWQATEDMVDAGELTLAVADVGVTQALSPVVATSSVLDLTLAAGYNSALSPQVATADEQALSLSAGNSQPLTPLTATAQAQAMNLLAGMTVVVVPVTATGEPQNMGLTAGSSQSLIVALSPVQSTSALQDMQERIGQVQALSPEVSQGVTINLSLVTGNSIPFTDSLEPLVSTSALQTFTLTAGHAGLLSPAEATQVQVELSEITGQVITLSPATATASGQDMSLFTGVVIGSFTRSSATDISPQYSTTDISATIQ